MKRSTRYATPRPFLKWAGGKGQLLGELLARVDTAEPFGRYHEPFVGGGALFFELARTGRLDGRQVFLLDGNANLMDVYRAVKNCVETLIHLLQEHKRLHDKAYYYLVRSEVPAGLAARAARIIYLNRTCFNGLYRENRKGEFNVPFGRYVNPKICDEDNLRACAQALESVDLKTRSFESVLDYAERDDFVYFDPPYVPISKTASFTAYDKAGFGEDSQRRLAEVFSALTERGVKALLSNSMTDLVTELYAAHRIDEVFAKRLVNSRADRRGKIGEALVRNF